MGYYVVLVQKCARHKVTAHTYVGIFQKRESKINDIQNQNILDFVIPTRVVPLIKLIQSCYSE